MISGFLGAGKTSFIKAMAKATGRDFVILENEFADTDVDGATLKRKAPGMQVWELAEGCICCSLNLDFTYSVLTIENTLHPDYLIVEPSGVARPAQIVRNLAKLNYEKLSLLAPVTVVDSTCYRRQRRDFPDYFNDQLLSAGTIILSKSEHLPRADFRTVKEDLSLAEDVNFPEQHYSLWKMEEWQRFFQTAFTGTDLKKIGARFELLQLWPKADMDLTNFTIRTPSFSSLPALYLFLEDLLRGCYGEVVRAKGQVYLDGGWFHIELAGRNFTIEGLGEDLEPALAAAATEGSPAGDSPAENSPAEGGGQGSAAVERGPSRLNQAKSAAALVIIGKKLKMADLAALAARP